MPGGLTYSTDEPTTNDNEFSLLAKLARAYGATPVPNDNEAALLKKILVAVNAGVTPEPPPPSVVFLGSFGLGDIDSFSRSVAAGFTGSGEAAFQREAAVDVLRSAHFSGGVQCVLLEDDPSPCALVAPGVPSVTPGENEFSATFTAIPVTASLLRYEYRLDNTGGWTSNGTSDTLTDIAAAPGDHVLNVRAVSTSGVAGATATSASFEVTGGGGAQGWVQQKTVAFDPWGTTRNVVLDAPVGANHCITVDYQGGNHAGLSVSDGTNTWNTILNGNEGGGSQIAMAVALNVAAGTPTISITVPSTSDPGRVRVTEWAGVAAASAVDDSDGKSEFTANISIGLTTTVANTILVGVMRSGGGGVTAGSGFTLRANTDVTNLEFEDKIVAASGAQTVGFVHGERGAGIAAYALKLA